MAEQNKPARWRRRPNDRREVTSTVEWPGRKEGDPILFGYARVSTEGQDLQRQVDELVRAGVHPHEIWADVGTGAHMDREEWHDLLGNLTAGDVLVIPSLERLSRDTLDLLRTIRELEARGVTVRVLNFGLDTSTPIGQFAMTIFGAFGQLEREMALERTRSGIARAKERGVPLGSKKKFTDEKCWAAYDKAKTIPKAAKLLKCSEMTIKRALARRPKPEDAPEPEVSDT